VLAASTAHAQPAADTAGIRAAAAKADSARWARWHWWTTRARGAIDYFELARWNGQWKIVNVLWALTPKEDQPRW